MRPKKYSTLEEQNASTKYSSIKARTKNTSKSIDNWSREDFIIWYTNQEKKCCYCGCTEEQLKIFHKRELYRSKRIKRGLTLEVERILDEAYSESNCKLACYWCNNAKSDAFTYDEFKPIGEAIGKAIKKAIK